MRDGKFTDPHHLGHATLPNMSAADRGSMQRLPATPPTDAGKTFHWQPISREHVFAVQLVIDPEDPLWAIRPERRHRAVFRPDYPNQACPAFQVETDLVEDLRLPVRRRRNLGREIGRDRDDADPDVDRETFAGDERDIG